jgi:hypothetical protein
MIICSGEDYAAELTLGNMVEQIFHRGNAADTELVFQIDIVGAVGDYEIDSMSLYCLLYLGKIKGYNLKGVGRDRAAQIFCGRCPYLHRIFFSPFSEYPDFDRGKF